MRKKGFTLIELLAVIIIIGLISVLAINMIQKNSEEVKEIAREEINEIIINSTKEYVSDNVNLQNEIKISDISTKVYLTDLTDNNYLDYDKINNTDYSKTIDKENSYIEIIYDVQTNSYEYNVILVEKEQ